MNVELTSPKEIMRLAELLRSVQVKPSSIVFRHYDLPECIVSDRELYRLADQFRKSVDTTIGAEGRTVLEMRAEAVLWRAYPRRPRDGNEAVQTVQQGIAGKSVSQGKEHMQGLYAHR